MNECSRADWLKEAVDLGFNGVMPVEPSGDFDAYAKFAWDIVDYAHPREPPWRSSWASFHAPSRAPQCTTAEAR